MMFDILPFLNIPPKMPVEEQVVEIKKYLIQFKESLEIILTNISAENLSQDLLNKLGTSEPSSRDDEEKVEQMQQAVKTLTVSDVVNSDAFKTALDKQYKFTINSTTGELEYTKS